MSVKKNIANGILISVLTKYSGLIVNLIISGILARLLSPEEFGIVGIAMVLITFFNLLGDFGISPAIIQNQTLTKIDYSIIFSLTIILAFFLSFLFFFSSNLISVFYESEELIGICETLSIIIFFNVLRVVPNAILLKNLQFKKLGTITILSQVISGLVGICLAYYDYGFYSLIIKSIVFSILFFFSLYFIYPIKPSFLVWESVKKISKFSSYQFGFNFINYFSRNLDNLLIGKFLGKSFLGYYEKSYSLMLLPVQNLTHAITPVLHPIFSSFSNREPKIEDNYFLICKILGFLGIPLSVFLFSSAEDIILILYGSNWTESVGVFKVLALSVGIQMVLSSSGSIFQASNRTDLLFLSGVISAVIMVSSICIGVFFFGDLVSIGICLLLSFCLNFIQTFYFLIKLVLNSSVLMFYRLFFKSFLVSLFLFILYFLYDDYFTLSPIFEVSIKLLIMVCSILFLILLDMQLRYYFFQFLGKRGKN